MPFFRNLLGKVSALKSFQGEMDGRQRRFAVFNRPWEKCWSILIEDPRYFVAV
jgi:hypothetical protein